MKKTGLLLFFSIIVAAGLSQTDPVGSGQAIKLDGIDDYIDLGNIYDDLIFPFSISAWVKVDPTATSGPVFVSQDNGPIYNGFWFYAAPSTIWVEYGDGRGEGGPEFRRGIRADVPSLVDRWNHVCAVVVGTNDMRLYLNGINVGGNYTGTSTLPMASTFPNDIAKIGYFFTNGSTYRYKGEVDEIRVFNRALSELEIRTTMCKKLAGNESGLIGYWNFDELSGNTTLDKSGNAFHGQLKNGPTRVFSGAPIGDESMFQYQSNWSGSSVTLNHASETVIVSDILGAPEGVHIYTVNSQPSQTGGLDILPVPDVYYGVFTAATDFDNLFTVSHTSTGEACGLGIRTDNSVSIWTDAPSTISNVSIRAELIHQANLTDVLDINLGDDVESCPFVAKTLQPLTNPSGYSFIWQDGSTQSTYQANDYGTYWVVVSKDCIFDRDTILFAKPEFGEIRIPNVFSPNEDNLNQFFVIDNELLGSQLLVYNRWGKQVYAAINYQNNWAGEGLPQGVYYFIIKSPCVEDQKGWVSIVR